MTGELRKGRWGMKRIGVLIVCLVVALGVSLGTALSASASYFQKKLFQPSGEKVEEPIAMSADGNTAFFAGHLQSRSGEEWIQQVEVTKGGSENSISADGNTLVSSSGFVPEGAYVYTRSGSVWGEPVRLEPESLFGKEPRFGEANAVSANGGTVLVGAAGNEERGQPLGGVWVFVRSGETWSEQAILHGEEGQSQCGTKTALSADGDTAVFRCGLGYGEAEIFVRKGETWTKQAGIAPTGQYLTLAPDGETLFTVVENSVRIYKRSGESWSLAGEIPPVVFPLSENEMGPVAIAPEGTHLLLNEGEEGVVLYEGSGASWAASEQLYPFGRGKVEGSRELALSTGAQVMLVANGGAKARGVWELTPGEPVQGPEFGRCVLHPHGSDGAFTDADCSKQKPKKGVPYEWTPGAVKAGFTLAASGVTLSTHSKQSISCSGLSGSGVLARKTLTGVHLTLAGCELAGQQCTSTMASPGEIDSEELAGALGVETEKPKAKIGIAISAPTVFAAFTCGTTAVSVRGGVIGSVKAGKPGASLTINFKASNGAQKPNHFVGGPEQNLEASFGGGPYESIGLRAKPTATYEEPLEISPAF